MITDREAKLRLFPHISEKSSESENLSLSSDCDDDLNSLSSFSENAESVGITSLIFQSEILWLQKCTLVQTNFSKDFIAEVVSESDADNDYEQ